MSRIDENYITLTSHNAKADTINQHQLEKLAGGLSESKAEVSGDFNENAYPADKTLSTERRRPDHVH